MKSREQQIRDLLHRGFAPFLDVPQQQVDSACERVLSRLKEEPDALDAGDDVVRRPRVLFRPVFVVSTAAAMILFFTLPVLRNIPSGIDAYAIVEAANGGLRRFRGEQILRFGERVEAGEVVRTTDDAGGLLRLADGSAIEMRSNSELSFERADDGVQVRLNAGAVIVSAATQHRGHLYVKTNDVRVSVTGTVFLVNAEEEGSRVAVIEGEVRVQKGEAEQRLRRGEQVMTSPLMEARPVKEEISWSQNAPTHVAQLQSTGEPAILTGSISGIVRTAGGAPASGVRISAIPNDSNDPALLPTSRMAVTDATGRYRLEDVLQGTYAITAGYSGTREISKTAIVSITSDARVASGVDFVLEQSRLTFEEISVRPSRVVAGTGERGQGGTVAVIQGCTIPPRIDPQQFIAVNTTLYNLIALTTGYGCAYVTSLDLVTGGPGWIKSDLFDVQAVLPPGSPRYTARSPELQAMVRALLEDRFKLTMRREVKERSFYELRLGNEAPKLKPWKEGDAMELNGQPLNLMVGPPGTYLGMHWAPDPIAGESFMLVGRNVTTAELANWIARAVNRPVVDQTGLTGKYGFDVEYSKDGLARPMMPAAIRDQLGLRLEDATGPFEVFVIDRVERPSEN